MRRVIFLIIALFISNDLMADQKNIETFTIGEFIKYKAITRDCEINGYKNSTCDVAIFADAYLIGYIESLSILYEVCETKDSKYYTKIDCGKFKYCWPKELSKNDFSKIASAYAYDNFKDWKDKPAYLIFYLTLKNVLKCK